MPVYKSKPAASDGALSAQEQNRRHQEWLDEQPAVVRCGIPGCRFVHEGTIAAGRAAHAAHRARKHPGLESEAVARRRAHRQSEKDRKAANEAAAHQARKEARVAKVKVVKVTCDRCKSDIPVGDGMGEMRIVRGKVTREGGMEKGVATEVLSADLCGVCLHVLGSGDDPIEFEKSVKEPWGSKAKKKS